MGKTDGIDMMPIMSSVLDYSVRVSLFGMHMMPSISPH
jgi:hypothetical protein